MGWPSARMSSSFTSSATLQCHISCAEDFMFQGPKWRTEPSDLILPYNSPDQKAVIKCEAEGTPSPQYRPSPPAVLGLQTANRCCFSGWIKFPGLVSSM
ncbi:unnamed protein product [Arctogadus glacialis]